MLIHSRIDGGPLPEAMQNGWTGAALENRVVVSAPGKLMLFGEHGVVYQRPCIVTAVDQRIRVYVERTGTGFLRIEAPNVGVNEYEAGIGSVADSGTPKGARFIVAAVRNFDRRYGVRSGVTIRTKSEFSSEFGFGSSSAVTVAVLKALSELFEVRISNDELFGLSYRTVLDVQAVGSGFDLAAAIWGGTLCFRSAGPKIDPLDIEGLPLIVGYTGVKADTASLVRAVADLRTRYKNLTDRIFDIMADLVEQAREALVARDVDSLGALMNINQGLLDSLGVNSLELSRLIYAAREAGATGAKLSGAGGGDCMIALSPEPRRQFVEEAIESAGGKLLGIRAGAPGVQRDPDSEPW